jgi:adenine/guanine/hypoxanthine permease
MISTILAWFGPLILKYIPPVALLLVPITGIGIVFLGLEQITSSIATPIVGYYAIMFVYIGWYAGVRVGFGKYFPSPEALQVVLVGAVLDWTTGLNTVDIVKDTTKDRCAVLGPAAKELFTGFPLVKDYLGIVLSIAISATVTTLMCLVSAKQAGDPYPVLESMIVDGIGAIMAIVRCSVCRLVP